MLNDYKPTHDPNLDTFKVQYLLGISTVLALLFPHDYRFSEVGDHSIPTAAPAGEVGATSPADECLDPLDLFHLARVCRDLASVVHVATDRRSRHHYHPLPVRLGLVPGSLYPQLAVPIFHRTFLPAVIPARSYHCWHRPDLVVL